MTGRGMRSVDDYCDTYILDSQFMSIYRKNGNLLPKWWKDAIVASSGNTMSMYDNPIRTGA